MFHIDNKKIRELLLSGNFGLEKESLRVTPDGFMSHTLHPFPDNKYIVRDFCENQTEINTPVLKNADDAVRNLYEHTVTIQKKLAELDAPELLWPFSNPPFIINEADVPIAQFNGDKASKTAYREYLSDRYGRYKMTFCGIHVNYSFSDELLKADFEISEERDYKEYLNQLYLNLAAHAATYSWIITAVTAASPLLDSSYVEKGHFGENEFNGMSSTRCSELGYWNYFAPILDYTSIESYVGRIQYYVDLGLIAAPSELYYPVRLKPRGENNLDTLKEHGVDHIELRMVDLNPLCPEGIDVRDLKFAQLLLTYLACLPKEPFSPKNQIQAIQNFKNAAHYDLKTVKIVIPDVEVLSLADAGLQIIEFMKSFYNDIFRENEELGNKDYSLDKILDILNFEEAKFINPENRYSWKIRKQMANGYVKDGLELAKKYQEDAVNV